MKRSPKKIDANIKPLIKSKFVAEKLDYLLNNKRWLKFHGEKIHFRMLFHARREKFISETTQLPHENPEEACLRINGYNSVSFQFLKKINNALQNRDKINQR